MTISATELQSIQQTATASYHAAQRATGGAGGLLDEAYRDAKEETSVATGNDAAAAVARKFTAIFAAFALFTQDDNHIMNIPVWSGVRAEIERRKRAVLDRHPATAAWAVERDERAAALQARIDLNAANLAERLHQGYGTAVYSERKADFLAILKD